MKNLELSVIIVNFNAGQFLIDCLSSLQLAREQVGLDIWVVDNGSTDESLQKAQHIFPHINYIKNSHNLGFGKANNIAFKRVKSEYILLLNPDCTVAAKTLKFMLEFMRTHQDVGAASCKLEQADGSIDWAAHRGFPTPWAALLYFGLGNDSLYHLTSKDMSKAHEVDAISGAFFMTRKSVLKKIKSPAGGFDEDYFLYAEDIDLCFRIKEAGYKIMYVPDVVVLHHKGITSGIKKHSRKVSLAQIKTREKALNSFYETMQIFYQKHLAKKYPFFINWLVYLGINLKWFLAKRKMHV